MSQTLSLQNSQASGEARFGSYNLNLVKLHGSLSWITDDAENVVEVPSASARPVLDDFITNGGDLGSVLIQPTSAKYIDTIGFIYGELIRRFTDFLARPNTTLIVCGYGFNDEHINRLLSSGLLNPTLQLIIYYPEFTDTKGEIPNKFLERVRSLNLPRVIIRGGGKEAYLENMVRELPDPAMTDDLSTEAKRMLNLLAKGASETPTPPAADAEEAP